MENLIPVVNKLQDVFGAIGSQEIDLPQIVVVGSQSSGKSSVLESIVGRDFLPRGTGIVTRRPLILQLYSLPSTAESPSEEASRGGDEWGEFLHLPGRKFYDFEAMREEIAKETDRVTGRNKGISNQSINLKIFSPHVLNLTLVDLPGITKVPTGDQPEDVEEQIRSMCLQFISNPNAIILAVTAANQDLANSDGLKLARSVDPEGDRTIGVLTKVDIMDAGTDCMDVLCNRVIPLKKGYIAVKNRSQKDIQENLPIRSGLQKETAYFMSHPRYRTVPAKCGTENLAIALNQILMRHIRDCLPDIKARILKMMSEVQSNIDSLGESAGYQDTAAQSALLLSVIYTFVANINSCVDGKAAASTSIAVDLNELYGGARISFIFNENFGNRLRSLDPFDGLDDNDIRTAIANANGTRPSLFVPEISFDLLVRRQIARLEQPGLQCVDYVYDEMQRMALQCETPELTRFPELRERVFEIVNCMLRDCMKPTQRMISNIIEVELAYINTSHPDFIGGKQAISQITKKLSQAHAPPQPQASAHTSEKEKPAGVHAESEAGIRDNRSPPIATATAVPVQATPQQAAPASVQPTTPASASSQAQPPAPPGGFFSMFTKAPSLPPTTPTHDRYDTHSSRSSNSMQVTESVVKLPQVPENVRVSNTAATTDWGRRETEIIKTLISSYFDIVKKTFMDMVPKTIMRFLVNGFRERIQTELVSRLYKDTLKSELLRETDDIELRRKASLEQRDILQRALDIVNEVRSSTSTSSMMRSSLSAGTRVRLEDGDDGEEPKGFVSRRSKR